MPKVREAIKAVERDGRLLVRITGSHRHFKHPEKPGTVTIPGHPGEDLHPKTSQTILSQAGLRRRNRMKLKFVVVFLQMPNNYCAYLPDLPG